MPPALSGGRGPRRRSEACPRHGEERLVRRSSKSEGGSDTHHVLNDGDGFREGLDPSCAPADFARRANQFGFPVVPCPVPLRKIFRFSADPNQIYIHRCPVPQRGDRASSRARGGMRWTRERQARKAIAGRDEPRERSASVRDDRRLSGRQSRVVLTPVAGAKLAEAKSSPTGFDEPLIRQ